MGTRSLTHIKEKNNSQTIITLYKQMDGYPNGWGRQLADFLDRHTITNGIPIKDNRKIANGVGCLIGQLISEVKGTNAGGIYVYTPDAYDCGEEYEYHVEVCDMSGDINIKIYDTWEKKFIFKGTPLELLDKYKV